jgi:hypothetical protein
MPKKITKVKPEVKGKVTGGDEPSWNAVLADLNAEIASLRKLVPIVERKVKQGDPWPGTATPL